MKTNPRFKRVIIKLHIILTTYMCSYMLIENPKNRFIKKPIIHNMYRMYTDHITAVYTGETYLIEQNLREGTRVLWLCTDTIAVQKTTA